MTRRLQCFEALDLVARGRLGCPVADSQFPGHTSDRLCAITRQDFHPISGLLQGPDRLGRIVENMVIETEPDRRTMAFCEPERTAGSDVKVGTNPFSRTKPAGDAVNHALKSKTREFPDVRRDGPCARSFDERAG